MDEKQEFSFDQAIASVALETQCLTEDIVAVLKQSIIDNKSIDEILTLIES